MTDKRRSKVTKLGSSVQRSDPSLYPYEKSNTFRRRVATGVLILLALALITASFRSAAITALQDARSTALQPFQVTAERIAQPFQDAYDWFGGLVHAKSENAELRNKVDELRNQAFRNQQAAEENNELRRLLAYVRSSRFPRGYHYVATAVVSPAQGTFDQTIVVGAGRNHNVRRDDAVVTADGLVGKVTKVGLTLSEVMLLTDESSAVSAVDQNHPGATGIIKHGQGGVDTLIFDRVDKSQNVAVGDPVITEGSPADSQLPSLYPRGIPIGVVTSVGQNDTDLYKQIQVQPFVESGPLRSVLVLIPKST